MSKKKIFLIRSEILGLLDKTLNANYQYSRSNRANLHVSLQINLSEKPSMCFCIVFPLLESTLNLQSSDSKRTLIGQAFLKLLSPKMCLFKCIEKLLTENHLAVQVLTSLKNTWNLQKSIFALVFYHSEPNWDRKS